MDTMHQPIHKESRTRLYLKIATILSAISIALSLLFIYVTYPTAAHRDVSSKMRAIESNAFKDIDNGYKLYETKEYKNLANSSENSYSTIATIITLIVSIVISITIIGYVFNYIRKNHIAKHNNARHASVMLLTISEVVAMVVSAYPTALLTGLTFEESITGPFVGLPLALIIPAGLLFSTLFIFVINYVIVRIFEHFYNKKNSFVVEQ